MIPGIAGSFDTGAITEGGGGGAAGVTVTLAEITSPLPGYAYTASTTNPYGLGLVGTLLSDNGLLGGGTVNTCRFYFEDGTDPAIVLVMEGGHTGSTGYYLLIDNDGTEIFGVPYGYDIDGGYTYYGFYLTSPLVAETISFQLYTP